MSASRSTTAAAKTYGIAPLAAYTVENDGRYLKQILVYANSDETRAFGFMPTMHRIRRDGLRLTHEPFIATEADIAAAKALALEVLGRIEADTRRTLETFLGFDRAGNSIRMTVPPRDDDEPAPRAATVRKATHTKCDQCGGCKDHSECRILKAGGCRCIGGAL